MDKTDYEKAVADLSEAIRLSPGDFFCYACRGWAYQAKKDLDKAIADFTAAVKLNPRDYASYSSRSLAYLEKREFDKALADLNLLLRAGPKNITNYQRRAYVYWLKQDYDKAIEDYSQAIRLNPKAAGIFLARAQTYSAKGDFVLPKPWAVTFAGLIPCATRYSRTALARFSDNFMLYSSPPTLSVWPSTARFRLGWPSTIPPSLASFSLAPGFKVYLLKSNSTSEMLTIRPRAVSRVSRIRFNCWRRRSRS